MYGASGDAHLRTEVPGACRGLSLALEALRRNSRVHIYLHLRAELLQLARVVTRDVAGESGLLENEPTVPAEQAHTTLRQ